MINNREGGGFYPDDAHVPQSISEREMYSFSLGDWRRESVSKLMTPGDRFVFPYSQRSAEVARYILDNYFEARNIDELLRRADEVMQDVQEPQVKLKEGKVLNTSKLLYPDNKKQFISFKDIDTVKKVIFAALLFGWEVNKDNNGIITIKPMYVWHKDHPQAPYLLVGRLSEGQWLSLGSLYALDGSLDTFSSAKIGGIFGKLAVLYDVAQNKVKEVQSVDVSGEQGERPETLEATPKGLIEVYKHYSKLQEELEGMKSKVSELTDKYIGYQDVLATLERIGAGDSMRSVESEMNAVGKDLKTLKKQMRQLLQEKQKLEAQYKVFSDPDFERAVRVLEKVEDRLKEDSETIVSAQSRIVETLSGVIGVGDEAVLLEAVRVLWDRVDPEKVLRSVMGEEDFEQLSPEIRQLIVEEVQQLKQRMLEHQLSSMSSE